MTRKHDPRAAEKLIDHVIKSQPLRDLLKKKAQQEEEEFKSRPADKKRDTDPFENLPL